MIVELITLQNCNNSWPVVITHWHPTDRIKAHTFQTQLIDPFSFKDYATRVLGISDPKSEFTNP